MFDPISYHYLASADWRHLSDNTCKTSQTLMRPRGGQHGDWIVQSILCAAGGRYTDEIFMDL